MEADRETLPAAIRRALEDTGFVSDTVGMSGGEIRLFPDRVLKIREDDAEARDECRMLRWLEGRLPVPRVLAHAQADQTHYLLMARLHGRMACDEVYIREPGRLAAMLAEALRRLWQVEVTDCPVDQRLDRKLEAAARRVEHGLVDMADAEPGTYGANGFRSPEALLYWLADNRPPEEPVLSHGDFCLPNLLLHGDTLAGYIDLGRAGLADRWQDIALCHRSLLHNYDGTYSGIPHAGWYPGLLFEALGLRPDWERIRYYILLDELF